MLKKLLLLPLFSAVLISPPSFASLSSEELNIGIGQEFDSLNPMIMNMVASVYLNNLTQRALVSMSTDGKWYPQLAKSIPTIENKQAKFITVNGKKTVQATWEIIEAAKWSDGKPVTCEDFQFSREVADSPNVSVASKETYTQVEKIEWDAKNPKKCTFTYDKARWDFNQLGMFFPIPKHIEGPVFAQFGKEPEGYDKNTNYIKNPTLPGLASGPYRITELKLGSHVVFQPNPHFYGQPPSIKKITIKLIPNTATLEANLRSGTIDKISSVGLSFDQALALDKKTRSEKLPFEVLFKPSLTYEHIDLNLDNPILKDVRVRKALVHAINREELVKALFENKQTAALHHVPTIDPWFTKDPKKIVLYPYSRKDANALLDQAGWKMGDDGIRTKDGKRLTLTLMTTAGNKIRETVQTYLQSQWKAVGVEINLKNEPARVFFGETMQKRKYEAMGMYASTSAPESDPKPNFHSTQIPSEKNGFSGQNQMGWINPKVDELCEKIQSEFDSKKRKELAHQLIKIYTDEVPVIPLYYRADIAVVPIALKNFHLPGHQFAETNEAETWKVVK